MVVVHPDQVAWLKTFNHSLAKNAIRFNIGIPARCIKSQLRRKAVKYWPKGLIGIALVKFLGDINGKLNRKAVLVSGPVLKNRTSLLADIFVARAGPADPHSTTPAQEWSHSTCQAA